MQTVAKRRGDGKEVSLGSRVQGVVDLGGLPSPHRYRLRYFRGEIGPTNTKDMAEINIGAT